MQALQLKIKQESRQTVWKCLLAGLLIFMYTAGWGQGLSQQEKTGLTNLRTRRMAELSRPYAGPVDSLWYVGVRYNISYIQAIGTPYFFNKSSLGGTVVFNGTAYPDQQFIYDLVRDELVVRTLIRSKGIEYIVLNKDWVGQVTLDTPDGTCILVTDRYPNTRGYPVDPGYYELVYEGSGLILLAKHRKSLDFVADQSDHNVYNYERALYLLMNNHVFDVSRQRDLTALFPDHRKEIRILRRESGHSYEEATPDLLKEWMQFCDEIVQERNEGK